MKIAVVGANGRMGRAVVRLAHDGGMQVVAAIGAGDLDRDAGELAGVGPIAVRVVSSLDVLAKSKPDVVVDFSLPTVFASVCEASADAGAALVSGTTGIDDAGTAALERAAKKAAVLWEPNMSVGVHVLSTLVAQALKTLGEDFDTEIVEAHHRMKVDAPSGTALRLAEVVRAARGGDLVHGREGKPGARKASEIGMHAMRGGDVIGDHTVFLFGDGERVELTHRASSRDLFARGALRAAKWIAGKAAGRYRLADVLA